MREALEYVRSYVDERDDWESREALIGYIEEALSAPRPAEVELTDEEIKVVHFQHWLDDEPTPDNFVAACRAIIAAHDKKNGRGG